MERVSSVSPVIVRPVGTFDPRGVPRCRVPCVVELWDPGTITGEVTVADTKDHGNRAELLEKATAQLSEVAAAIDSLFDLSNPSIELIEATRIIHGAINAVDALRVSLCDVQTAPLRCRARSVGGDVRLRPNVSSSASAPGATPVSILYDDILEPMSGGAEGERTCSTSMSRAGTD